MKKFILSVTTIIVFGLYSLFIKSSNVFYKATIPTPTTNKNTPPTQTVSNANSPSKSKSTNTTATQTTSTQKINTRWKDGTYVGGSFDAYYGNVQVSIEISNDRLTNISFLDYPQDRRTSLQKSDFAIPILKSEAIAAQSAYVNSVSGVTYTSKAFKESLSSALNKAKI